MCCIQVQHSHSSVVSYAETYPSFQSIKTEPGLQQGAAQHIKVEPASEYAAGYYAGDDDSNYDNYMYYDESSGMYTDPGGSFSSADRFADGTGQLMEYRKPRADQVLLITTFSSSA